MTLRNPGIFFRVLILGAQGVFYNMFCTSSRFSVVIVVSKIRFTVLSYLLSPRTCHRFVGYLEEEAVLTYTRCIEEMDAGLIPEW